MQAATVAPTGAVTAADLHSITEASATEPIDVLDLSQARIVEWSGSRIAANITSSPADVLPAYALSGLKAGKVILPASVTAIAPGAMMGSTVTEVVIPPSVTSIGQGAFAACTSLKKIDVPSTVTSMGSHTFAGCTALTSATLGCDSVPASVFSGCTALSSVTLAPSTLSIGDDAFAGCSSLSRLAMPASLRSVGARAFARSGLESLNMSGCNSLTAIGAEALTHCDALVTATLPANATDMGQGVFFDTPSLTGVTLPAALHTLPALTLKGAGIAEADDILPASLDSIGAFALAGMDKATSTVLPASLKHIGDGAFEGWSSMETLDASALGHVPSLGTDVWDGVDQSSVYLETDPKVTDLFIAAPQWRDFSFDSSGTTLIPGGSDGVHGFSARFEGNMLVIEAGEPLRVACLFLTDGSLVAKAGGSAHITFDTSGVASPFFILGVTLADGRKGAVKLLRQ